MNGGTRDLEAPQEQVTVRHLPGMGPPWMVLPVLLCLLFLLVPLVGVLTGAQWRDFPALVSSPASRDALRLSAVTTMVSTLVSVLLGAPLAYWLAVGATGSRPRRWVTKVLRTLVSLPIVLPPVVAGLALLLVLGRRGLLGRHLAVWGIDIGFTTTAVVIAQVFVAMPYLVVSLEGALRARGFELEETARHLGASRSRTLWTVTLPLSAPALTSGVALTFSRALGEFGATLTFAGSLQGTTRTLPLEIYLQRESDTPTALSLAIVLILVACTVVGGGIFLTGRWQARLFPDHVPPDVPSPDVPTSGVPTPDQPAPHLSDPAHTAPGIRVDATVAERGVHVDQSFAPGTVTAVVGPNGAGKSTLLGLVSGTVVPTRGQVVLTGAGNDSHTVVLSQRALLFPHLSVLDNVAFGLRARGVPTAVARERARAELSSLGIAHLAARRAPQLSGGQAQRVAIARAMATDPDVLLLDEPMAALDQTVAQHLRHELARRLAGTRTTVLLATHDPSDVAALAGEVLLLRDGEVRVRGPWREVFDTDDPFVLGLTGRHAATLGGRRVVLDPLTLHVAGEHEVGFPVVVEGTSWRPWGAVLLARTASGDVVSFTPPTDAATPFVPGDTVTLALPEAVTLPAAPRP